MRGTAMRWLLTILCAATLGGCGDDEAKLAGHLDRGDTYLEGEEYAEAIIEYKNVLQIDPNHGAAHWGLARAYLRSKQTRDGFWELRETVRLDPSNLEAKLQFGQIAIYAGELDEARAQRIEGGQCRGCCLRWRARPRARRSDGRIRETGCPRVDRGSRSPWASGDGQMHGVSAWC